MEKLQPRQTNKQADGIEILMAWSEGKIKLPLSPTLAGSEQLVKPVVRGVPRESAVVFKDLLQTHPVLIWYSLHPESFQEAARRDSDFGQSLESISEIVEDVVNDPVTSQQCSDLLTGALSEKLSELTHHAYPHMPTTVYERVQGFLAMREQILVELEENIAAIQEGGLNKLEQIKQRRSHTRECREDSEDYDQRVKPSHSPTSSPLLDKERHVGDERKIKADDDKTIVANPNETKVDPIQNVFVVTRVMNKYDPENGVLFADAPLVPFTPSLSSSLFPEKISMPLGIVPSDTEMFSLPWPIPDTNGLRYCQEYEKKEIRVVTLLNDQGQVMVSHRQVKDHLLTDSLGNMFLSVTTLPEYARRIITNENITIEVIVDRNPLYGKNQVQEWLGPLSPDEARERLSLYPVEISNLIQTLMRAKLTEEYPLQNPEIFSRIAKFLGNYWLAYDEEDARKDPLDPIGFYQTERVLEHNFASCEGTALALGQLMRHFLSEREGICFIEGYVVGGDGTATSRDFHAKVAYRDQDGETYYLDATPWSQETHDHFQETADRYQEVKNQWYMKRDTARLAHGITYEKEKEAVDQAQSAWDKLREIWPSLPIYTLPKEVRTIFNNQNVSSKDIPSTLHSFSTHQLIAPPPQEIKKGILRKNIRIEFSPEEGQNLIKFLLKAHAVDETFRQFWQHPQFSGLPLYGVISSSLRLFDRPLYGAVSSSDLESYLQSFKKLTMLYPSVKRDKVISQMAGIYAEGHLAMVQNTQAITTLTTILDGIRQEYDQKLFSLFGSVSDRIGSEVKRFYNAAPFFHLLDTPLPYLKDIFTRSLEPETRGFLIPNGAPDIQTAIGQKLGDWRQKTDERLSSIELYLRNAPLTKDEDLPEKIVSSVLLWQDSNTTADVAKVPEKKRLDPWDTFVFIFLQQQRI